MNTPINGSIFNSQITLYNFFKKYCWGVGLNFVKNLEKRLEAFSNYKQDQFNIYKYIVFINYMHSIIPSNKKIKDRKLLNIFFLDLIFSYKGWRHSKGLPVRGQRTWTNAWNSYKTNLFLREHKILMAKRVYGNISSEKLNVSYLAEQINLLWKLQWESEWKSARKKLLRYSSRPNYFYKIDLSSVAKGHVGGSSKKSKQKGKDYINMGFDPGFTKMLLKHEKFFESNKSFVIYK